MSALFMNGLQTDKASNQFKMHWCQFEVHVVTLQQQNVFTQPVPEGKYPVASEWGSLFAATSHPGWQSGRSAPSPQRSSLFYTCLWRTGTSEGSQTPGTGLAASEYMPHLTEIQAAVG